MLQSQLCVYLLVRALGTFRFKGTFASFEPQIIFGNCTGRVQLQEQQHCSSSACFLSRPPDFRNSLQPRMLQVPFNQQTGKWSAPLGPLVRPD